MGDAAASTLVTTETEGRLTEVNEVCPEDGATGHGVNFVVLEGSGAAMEPIVVASVEDREVALDNDGDFDDTIGALDL